MHTPLSFEAWLLTFQSSEQAARSAYKKVQELADKVAEYEKDAERYRWMRDSCRIYMDDTPTSEWDRICDDGIAEQSELIKHGKY